MLSLIKLDEKKHKKLCFFYGAYDGTRTHDLSLTKAVRYLLRHISILKFECVFCSFLSGKICYFLFYQGCAIDSAPLKHEANDNIKISYILFCVKYFFVFYNGKVIY